MSGGAKLAVAGVLVLSLAWACGAGDEPAATSVGVRPVSPSVAAAPAPVWDPRGVVARVSSPADVVLRDGRAIHVPALNAVVPWRGRYLDECERTADLELARRLLDGKPVTLTAPPRLADVQEIVPSGHVQADVEVGGRDYGGTFTDGAYDARAKCRPTYEPAPATDTTPPPSGGDVDVDLDHHDTNHRDGSATFGFCRHRRWC